MGRRWGEGVEAVAGTAHGLDQAAGLAELAPYLHDVLVERAA